MQVQIEHVGALEATIEVKLSKNEVETEVNKALKEYQRKAAMPGFRPGKVPFGMIKKMYGTAITADQINRKVSDALHNYLEENKIQYIGYPVADFKRNGTIDFDGQNDYSFYFLLGLKPVLDFDFSSMVMECAKVNVDEAEVNRTIEKMLVDHPRTTNPDLVGPSDNLFLKINEATAEGREVEGGYQTKIALNLADESLAPLKPLFEGRPEGDEFVIHFAEYLPKEKVAELLKLNGTNADLADKPFNVVIDEIWRSEPSELNEEFFNRIFPGQEIKTEEAFREKIAEEIQKHFDSQADYLSYLKLLKQLVTEENIPLPENFLKHWIVENAGRKENEVDLEKDFERYKRSFRFQVFVDYLQQQYPELKVSPEEVRSFAFNQYYGQYLGALGNDEALVNRLIDNMDELLRKNGESERIQQQLEEQKMIRFFKDKLKIDPKPMSIEEFNEYAKTLEN